MEHAQDDATVHYSQLNKSLKLHNLFASRWVLLFQPGRRSPRDAVYYLQIMTTSLTSTIVGTQINDDSPGEVLGEDSNGKDARDRSDAASQDRYEADDERGIYHSEAEDECVIMVTSVD